jgi:hypothetical protein
VPSSMVVVAAGPRLQTMTTLSMKAEELWPDAPRFLVPLTVASVVPASSRPSYVIVVALDPSVQSMPAFMPISRLRAKAYEATRFRCTGCQHSNGEAGDADVEMPEIQADDLEVDLFDQFMEDDDQDAAANHEDGDDEAAEAVDATRVTGPGGANKPPREIWPYAHGSVVDLVVVAALGLYAHPAAWQFGESQFAQGLLREAAAGLVPGRDSLAPGSSDYHGAPGQLGSWPDSQARGLSLRHVCWKRV